MSYTFETRRTWTTLNQLAVVACCCLASCAPDPQDVACSANCELEIFLPENPELPPRVPPVIRVVEDQAFTVSVWGRRPAQAHSLLVFAQPAIEDASGRPQFTVELLPGQTTLNLRPYEAGVCHAPDGCSFFVVNTGLLARPAATSPGGTLIIESASAFE